MNIHGDNWLLFKEWYQNLTTKVKWEGQISRGFEKKQGVRQRDVKKMDPPLLLFLCVIVCDLTFRRREEREKSNYFAKFYRK
jgi:hypothetical protein